MSKNQKLSWGKTVLGPVTYNYIDTLHAALTIRGSAHPVQALFCTRAGVRIIHLMNLFHKMNKIKPNYQMHLFGTSRLLAAKACYIQHPSKTFEMLAKEFGPYPFGKAVRALFARETRDEIDLSVLEDIFSNEWHKASELWMFEKLFRDGNETSEQLRNWYTSEGENYLAYVDGFLKLDAEPVIIDTGWRGTQQHLLEVARPNADWFGMYFGRWGADMNAVNPNNNKLGLMFENETYDPRSIKSSISLCHHIIEDLLEPPFPSVSQTSDLELVPSLYKKASTIDKVNDEHFSGVVEYFKNLAPASFSERIKEKHKAWEKLHQVITRPTFKDVVKAMPRSRSADFGKEEANAVVFFKDSKIATTQSERIRRALWKPAQYAVEFEGKALTKKLKEFNAYFQPDKKKATGSVAIITRTKDRAVLLRRAAKSIFDQNYKNYQWVIVNDDGDIPSVEETVLESGVDLRKVRIVHRSKSIGMEAASNAAIEHSDKTDYIVIHDDDDSWEPDFLKVTTTYLDNPPTPRHKGVVTGTTRYSEVIINDEYSEIIGQQPYNDWLRTINFVHLLEENTFAPIAFLFSRDLYEEIGGFNESLPVLGDWDFNLSYLSLSEIGVVPTPLANYFHRDLQKTGVYSNSVFGAIDKHMMYGTGFRNDMFRNKALFLRDDIKEGIPQSMMGPLLKDLKVVQNNNLLPAIHDSAKSHQVDQLTAKIDKLEMMLGSLTNIIMSSEDSVGAGSTNMKLSYLSSFQTASVNSKVHVEEHNYEHIQLILEGIEAGEGKESWFDFRLCRHNENPYLEIRNHGSNFEFLSIANNSAVSLQLHQGGVITYDGKPVENNPQVNFSTTFFNVLKQALYFAYSSGTNMDEGVFQGWDADLTRLKEGVI